MGSVEIIMRIGINILFLIPNRVGGTEYYARSLLAELEKQDTTNCYVIFCNKENANTVVFSSPKWKKVICPVYAENRLFRVLFEQLMLPILVFKESCDVLHSLGYTSPFFSMCPRITTIHDANWRDMPQDSTKMERIALDFLITLSAYSSKYIVTQSIFASNRLQRAFPRLKRRIKISQPGLDPELLSLISSKQERTQQKYLLCVSGLYPHKNIPYLFELWRRLSELLPAYKLVLVGQNGKDEEKVKKLIQEISSVCWYPKVSRLTLARLYQSAAAFIFPSVYEGFGFPVYEALAARLPVFVGSKKPFQEISNHLNELSFDIESDAEMVFQKLHHPSQHTYHLPNYKKTANEIRKLYQDSLR